MTRRGVLVICLLKIAPGLATPLSSAPALPPRILSRPPPGELGDEGALSLHGRALALFEGHAAPYTQRGRSLLLSDTSTLTLLYADGSSLKLPHSEALFGIPAYGGGVQARIYYPKTGSDGCVQTSDPPSSFPSPFMMLLDRGGVTGCTFTLKVLNAQRAGAVGVIIADNQGLCTTPAEPACPISKCRTCEMGYPSDPQCGCSLPTMADDGTGSSVTIPSMMISRVAGNALKGVLSTTGAIGAMKWDIPNDDGQVEFSLWSDANDFVAVGFRQAFAPYVPYLGASALFMPHYYIIDGRTWDCHTDARCSTQCINGGFYCSIDPDGDLNAGISGADVVMEDLRQMCVWQVASKTYAQDAGIKWWRYADAFSANCNSPRTWNAACSESQMSSVGIDVGSVRSCVTASNTTAAATAAAGPCTGSCIPDWTNNLLQVELNLRDEMNVRVLPSVTVEGVPLMGGLSSQGVLKAICAGFAANTAPLVCLCTDVSLAALGGCVSAAGGGGGGKERMPGWALALLLVVIFGTIISVGVGCYLYNRARSEAEELLDDYRALMEGPPEGMMEGEEGGGATCEEGAGATGAAVGVRSAAAARLNARYPPVLRRMRPGGAAINSSDVPTPVPSGFFAQLAHAIFSPPPPGSVAIPRASRRAFPLHQQQSLAKEGIDSEGVAPAAADRDGLRTVMSP